MKAYFNDATREDHSSLSKGYGSLRGLAQRFPVSLDCIWRLLQRGLKLAPNVDLTIQCSNVSVIHW
jgi:hypothetical protein